MRRMLTVTVPLLVGSALPAQALAGVDLGVSWVDCVVDPAVDADEDGLDDSCEYEIARGFEPELVFGVEETHPDRVPFWSARPEGDEMLRIFYAQSYLIDGGDPDFGGISGHDGDSEFVVLRVRYDGEGSWSLVDGYLSAHYDTLCDAGGWFPAEEFQYADEPRGRPLVFVAEGKHANYTDLLRCDSGGCFQDHCTDTIHTLLGLKPGRDLGLMSTPLIDEHVENGNSEWFWTDEIFCGWQVPPFGDRSGCVPLANSYAIELETFEMDYGPVTSSAELCEACSDDLECEDGGRCISGDCTRACEDGGCPAGSHCQEDPGSNVGQCQPDTTCECVLACVGRVCGDPGCGASCGECAPGEVCDPTGQCEPETPACEPQCQGRQCGDDSCGGSCGSCPDGQSCDNGECVAASGPTTGGNDSSDSSDSSGGGTSDNGASDNGASDSATSDSATSDSAGVGESEEAGCGCHGGGGPSAPRGLLALSLGLLALTRRRSPRATRGAST